MTVNDRQVSTAYSAEKATRCGRRSGRAVPCRGRPPWRPGTAVAPHEGPAQRPVPTAPPAPLTTPSLPWVWEKLLAALVVGSSATASAHLPVGTREADKSCAAGVAAKPAGVRHVVKDPAPRRVRAARTGWD